MPAKVIEPTGDQVENGANITDSASLPNIGYLLRTGSLDGNGDLKRIPFINKNGRLKNGDLVIFDIDRTNFKIYDVKNDSFANIAVAVIPEEFFSDDWNQKPAGSKLTIKQRWDKEWNGVSETNLNLLKPSFTRKYIVENINSFDDVKKNDDLSY